jgi:hypothetical protein
MWWFFSKKFLCVQRIYRNPTLLYSSRSPPVFRPRGGLGASRTRYIYLDHPGPRTRVGLRGTFRSQEQCFLSRVTLQPHHVSPESVESHAGGGEGGGPGEGGEAAAAPERRGEGAARRRCAGCAHRLQMSSDVKCCARRPNLSCLTQCFLYPPPSFSPTRTSRAPPCFIFCSQPEVLLNTMPSKGKSKTDKTRIAHGECNYAASW